MPSSPARSLTGVDPPFLPFAPAADYADFHAAALESSDVDPVYPVLAAIGDTLALTTEARLWLTFVYVAYYHLGSALAAFDNVGPGPGRPSMPLLHAPTGIERRAHRSPAKLAAHLDALTDIAASNGGLGPWLAAAIGSGLSRTQRWHLLTEQLTHIYGNGRWSSYKTAEMLWKVNGFPIAAPDMGHAHSTGPREGLALLFAVPHGNAARNIRHLDWLSEQLCVWLRDRGLAAPVEEVETTLCDFHALHRGKYYVGHDIDQMQAQLAAPPSALTGAAFAARSATLPRRFLGERNSWTGIRPDLNGAYRQGRGIAWWAA